MEQRYQFGTAKNATILISLNLENIINLGERMLLLIDVNADLQSSWEKIEHLILGWILAYLSFLYLAI
jgi:hypothetical protein